MTLEDVRDWADAIYAVVVALLWLCLGMLTEGGSVH